MKILLIHIKKKELSFYIFIYQNLQKESLNNIFLNFYLSLILFILKYKNYIY